MSDQRPWWQSAVVYQIYPRSFADGNGDGVGDLAGIRSRLDHIAGLGVDGLWLSPIFRSPMADFGYDVSDYCDVDPLFGDLAELDLLVQECHRRGLRLLLDWVPNHTSDQHPWFLDSRGSRDSPRRSWYVWRDPAPGGGPPNNWSASFSPGEPAWTWDEATEQYYLHVFLPQQPDLNWDEPAVQEVMLDTLRFWLDRGVDGFRMDVVHLIGKDLTKDDPPEAAATGTSHVVFNDEPVTHERLRAIRRVLDAYPGERTSVGEVYLMDEEAMASYYGHGDELHLSFNFAFLWARWDAAVLRTRIERTLEVLRPRGATPTWAFSNHDVVRHRERHGGDERTARAAALLLLTLPGTVFLYQGEELGLVDAVVPPQRRVDPGGRDGCRAPLPWDATPSHGWVAEPWLPFPPEADHRNAATQEALPDSILHLYRRVIALRAASPALRSPGLRMLDADDGVLAFERSDGDERVVVVVNTLLEPQPAPDGADGRVLVATDAGLEGGTAPAVLGPGVALVVRPG